MEKIRVSAKTLDEAITKAQIQLNTSYDNMTYKVLAEGSKGFLGIGAKPYIIEASVKENTADFDALEAEIKGISTASMKEEKKPQAEKAQKPAEKEQPKKEEKKAEEKPAREKKADKPAYSEKKRSEKPAREKKPERKSFEEKEQAKAAEPVKKERPEKKPVSPEDAAAAEQHAKEFIQSVLSGMGMQVSIEASFDHAENELSLNLAGEDMGILIGKRGQTLDSLQYLTSLVVNKDSKDEYIRVKLDTEDYRSRREATLKNLAKNIAYKVKRTRKTVSLEPMNPYERRIIHSALQNDRYVTTKSEGEEPFRHVVVMLKR